MSKNISEMTDPELNDAVAIEVMGWAKEDGKWIDDCGGCARFDNIDDAEKYDGRYWCPVYDLNQCYEAERKLCDDIPYEEYLTALDIVVWHPFGKVHASARQRCKAMLMAMRNG